MLVASDQSAYAQQFDIHNQDTPDCSMSKNASKYLVNDKVYGYELFPTTALDGSFCDPGYVSEKSESDDEVTNDHSSDESHQNKRFPLPRNDIEPTLQYIQEVCPFINNDTLFEVTISRSVRGLGLALTGGTECDVNWAGLIRIKKVYPQTPAHLSGRLQVDDFVLEANRICLTGLTSHEALEVLRTTGNSVTLLVARPFEDYDNPQNTPSVKTINTLTVPTHNLLCPSPSLSTCGEFEIQLSKINGSLGFTLRKQDNSILGHAIKSLVKEPALSDGRMRPGDKLLSVNGTDMCGMTHEEAVKFLRTCQQTVVLRLYRDALQTPVSPASPCEFDFIPKPLRQEARDMLSDIASRKSSSPNISSFASDGHSTARRRRLQKTPSPDLKTDDRWENLVKDSTNFNHTIGAIPIPQIHANESKPNRPNFLDLQCHRGSSRKTNFTPPHEEYPSPQLSSLEPLSAQSDTSQFIHSHPNYHSMHLGESMPKGFKTSSSGDLQKNDDATKNNGLMKWKGIVFSPEEECEPTRNEEVDSLQARTMTIELIRGWNSRLGFSLHNRDSKTVIAQVYQDSVAAKDGRLKPGDEIISINGVEVKDWPTDKVIDSLRKTTGKISLITRQKYF